MTKLMAKCLVLLCLAVSHLCSANEIIVSHPMGETRLKGVPERVVVLGMDSLDILDSLDIEPVGVVKAPLPAYLNKYQDDKYKAVGSLFEPNFESIYMLKPDLIIVSNRSSKSYAELAKIAPTVAFMADPANFWQSATDGWRMFAKIFNKQQQVDALIAQKEKQIEQIRARNQAGAVQVLVVMRNGGNLTTFGAKSRYNAIFSLFGFQEAVENQASYAHGDLISFEYIAQANPQYMLVLDRDSAIGVADKSAKETFDNPLINALPVYKNDNIQYLHASAWYISASGIQAAQLMIDDINAVITP